MSADTAASRVEFLVRPFRLERLAAPRAFPLIDPFARIDIHNHSPRHLSAFPPPVNLRLPLAVRSAVHLVGVLWLKHSAAPPAIVAAASLLISFLRHRQPPNHNTLRHSQETLQAKQK